MKTDTRSDRFELLVSIRPDRLRECYRSKNNLEASIIQSAPFAAGFLEMDLNFRESQSAPSQTGFGKKLKSKLNRNRLKLRLCLNG